MNIEDQKPSLLDSTTYHHSLDAKVVVLAAVTVKEHGDVQVNQEVAGIGENVDDRIAVASDVIGPADSAPLGTLLGCVIVARIRLAGSSPGPDGDDDVLGEVHPVPARELVTPAQYLPGDRHDSSHSGVVGARAAVDEVELRPDRAIAAFGHAVVRWEVGRRGGRADADVRQLRLLVLLPILATKQVRGEDQGI